MNHSSRRRRTRLDDGIIAVVGAVRRRWAKSSRIRVSTTPTLRSGLGGHIAKPVRSLPVRRFSGRRTGVSVPSTSSWPLRRRWLLAGRSLGSFPRHAACHRLLGRSRSPPRSRNDYRRRHGLLPPPSTWPPSLPSFFFFSLVRRTITDESTWNGGGAQGAERCLQVDRRTGRQKATHGSSRARSVDVTKLGDTFNDHSRRAPQATRPEGFVVSGKVDGRVLCRSGWPGLEALTNGDVNIQMIV